MVFSHSLDRVALTFAADPAAKRVLSRIRTEIERRAKLGSPSSDYIRDAAAQLLQLRGYAHAEVRLQCVLHCARHLFFHGHIQQSLECLRHMEKLATYSRSKRWTRTVNNCFGIVFAHVGNIAEALPRYERAVQLAKELREVDHEARVFMNLGAALSDGGMYREAVLCLQRVIDLAGTLEVEREVHNGALTNMAQALLHLGEYEAAFQRVNQALAQSEAPRDSNEAGSRVIREFTYVAVALELGFVNDARVHATQAIDFSRECGLRFQQLATVAMASCLAFEGDYDQSTRTLEETLSRCEDGVTRESVLIALFKAYEKADRPESALEYLEELLSHVRATRASGLLGLCSTTRPFFATGITSEEHDLRSLRYREARLRARVAERQVVTSQIEMLERFAIAADLREEVSGEHGVRVGRLSALFASRLEWTKDAIHALELGAKLHDIGKIGVPDRILLNTKDLGSVEKHFISAHTQIGAELLGKSQFPHVRIAEEIARHHHEWWNGEGYPSRLAGERIPKHARIVALADVFDALTHGRPYSPPWSFERAMEEIAQRRGTQFDPQLTDAFLALVTELHEQHGDLDAYLRRGQRDTPFAQARRRITAMLEAERNQEAKAPPALPEPSLAH